ncbi:hypothetical protein [Tenacibaculum agarivorans]|uniref:hypothetical protein n=1 Tax=Tenacibaculum agarivorans TaxID=1908389 RepID=UPI00094B9308|nr:hypothetical protein [Tenacibaculum agarivorans]
MKIITFLLLAIVSISYSQSESISTIDLSKFPKEQISVHYNNEFLVTGEKLYYKIYCFNQNHKLSNYSKIAYIELLSSENTSVLKQKIALEKGIGYGDFFINPSLKTDTYTLICYTQWMKNYTNYFENSIVIINPFSDRIVAQSDQEIISKKNTILTTSEQISTDKTIYQKREKVLLNLEKIKTLQIDKFSISVRKKDNFHLNLKNQKNADFDKITYQNTMFLPELRGNLIKGKIESNNNKNVANKLISLSIDHSHLPLIATTNTIGEFYFNIPNVNSQKVYIQILDTNASDFSIKLKEDQGIKKENDNSSPIKLTQNNINTIKERSIYAQIENAYYTVKEDIILPLVYNDSLLNHKKTTYRLDDYKRFKTLQETFVEIISSAKIRRIDQKQEIIVPSGDTKATGAVGNIPSLLIVDGHIVYDHDSFLNYDCSKISSISVINQKYCYGNSIYQGITFINTFKKDYVPVSNSIQEFKIMNIQPKKKYFFQEHNKINMQVPDYRTQLYWDPNVDSTKNEIVFYTSDVTGEFQIEIKGFTPKGDPLSFKEYFSVK